MDEYDDTDDSTDLICTYCDGSGDGMHDGEVCSACNGTGMATDFEDGDTYWESDN